jgi:hypothetical protein
MFISRLGASLLMARKPRGAKKFADVRQLTKELTRLIKRGTYMQALKKQLKQNLTLIFFQHSVFCLQPCNGRIGHANSRKSPQGA